MGSTVEKTKKKKDSEDEKLHQFDMESMGELTSTRIGVWPFFEKSKNSRLLSRFTFFGYEDTEEGIFAHLIGKALNRT